MQAGGISLFGVVADSIDRERLNQTYQSGRGPHGTIGWSRSRTALGPIRTRVVVCASMPRTLV
jgi:hypothetical protein